MGKGKGLCNSMREEPAMKLRIPGSGGAAGAAMQAPLLSPDGHSWCQLDAGGVIATSPHAVVLTGAHKDQVDGLLDLRRGSPINLYATPAVFEHLTQALPLLPVLEQYCGVQWHLIAVAGDSRQTDFTIAEWPTLQFTAITLGAAPSGERIALAVHDTATDRACLSRRRRPSACRSGLAARRRLPAAQRPRCPAPPGRRRTGST
jgi:hypothetical protein